MQTVRGTGHDALWLRLLAVLKFAKALLLVTCGVGILRLVHTNFGEQMAQLADILRYSTVSRVITALFDKASLLSDRRLEQLALVAFIYASTEMIESYGLFRRRMWAEYMTLGITVAFLPFDFYALAREPSWLKVAFTVLNVLIAWYLTWHIRRKRAVTHRQSIVASGA